MGGNKSMVLGAILGLVGAVIPELVRLYKDYSDKKHEIAMMKLQIENAEKMALLRVEEAKALAQMEIDQSIYEFAKPEIKVTGYWLADLLQALGNFLNMIVRPIITFSAMGLWLYGMYEGYTFTDWQSEAISCIIVFWFGNRSFQRALGRIG